jgi:hypothetical protein
MPVSVSPRDTTRTLLIWGLIAVVLAVVVYALFKALVEPSSAKPPPPVVKEAFGLFQDETEHAVKTIQLASASSAASNTDLLQMGKYQKSIPGPNPPIIKLSQRKGW